MFNFLIENQTPYLGKIVLKFEKDPHYTGSREGKLNKIHLDLGFTKLVSRMIPKRNLDGWMIDPVKIELIEQHTDGKIGTHQWFIIKDGEGTKEVNRKPKDESLIVNSFTLPNSFLTMKGKYIGDIETAWWYYKNGMTVCEDYPHGVALKWNTGYSTKTLREGQNGLLGYYGYSHRGGSLFKIGDRLFNEKYVPKEKDYTYEEWRDYVEKFEEGYDGADEIDKRLIYDDGIKSVIPFNKRGNKVIMTWEEAKKAAINMSKYLS